MITKYVGAIQDERKVKAQRPSGETPAEFNRRQIASALSALGSPVRTPEAGRE